MFPQKNWSLEDVVSLNISAFNTPADIQNAILQSQTFNNQVWANANPAFTGNETLPEHIRMVRAIACPNFTGKGLSAHVHTLDVSDSETFTGEELADHLSFWERTIGKRRGLRRLRVSNCPNFTGRNLPLSLEELDVVGFAGTTLKVHRRVKRVTVSNSPNLQEVERDAYPVINARGPFALTLSGTGKDTCPNFEGNHLPPNLRRLEVYSSEMFTGSGIPDGVKTLTVSDCPQFKAEYLQPIAHYERLNIRN